MSSKKTTKKKGPAHKQKKPARRERNSEHLPPSKISGHNRHHFLYPRREWCQTEAGRMLREHKNCVAEVPVQALHKIVHDHVPDVPYPGDMICELAFMAIHDLKAERNMSRKNLFLAKIETLISVFAQLGAYDTAAALNAQLDALMMHYHKIHNVMLISDPRGDIIQIGEFHL